MNFIKFLYKLWLSIFSVITIEKAEKLRLIYKRNIFGDEINRLNCRSIWTDGKLEFRVGELFLFEKNDAVNDGVK